MRGRPRGEACRAAGLPLHRCPDRVPALEGEVVRHADLLAVPQHRRARHAELQRVGQLGPRPVAAQHRPQPSTDTPVVQAHPLLRRELGKDVRPLFAGQPAQVQLVVVAQERRPLRHGRESRGGREGGDDGLRLASRQREPEEGVHREREQHVRAVVGAALGGRAVQRELLGVDVGLAQQNRVTLAPLQVLPPVVQDAEVQPAIAGVSGAHLLEHERRGVDAETRGAELEPEAHDLLDLLAHLVVGPVQVRLEVVEAVEVPRPRRLVPRPGLVLLTGEDDALVAVGRLLRRSRRTSRGTATAASCAPTGTTDAGWRCG